MEKTQQVKTFFDATDKYLKSNPVIALRKKILQEMLGKCQGMNIIDIGCGNGELTKNYLEVNKVTFLDISENMLSLARENIPESQLNNAIFINSDLTCFTTGHKFDIAVCFGVAAHVEDVSELVRKLKEITTDEGKIILQFTDQDKLLSKVNYFRYKLIDKSRYSYQISRTTSSGILRLLLQEGLLIEKESKYIPVSPLLSIFRDSTKRKLLLLSYRNKIFSKLSSEVVVCLSKISH